METETRMLATGQKSVPFVGLRPRRFGLGCTAENGLGLKRRFEGQEGKKVTTVAGAALQLQRTFFRMPRVKTDERQRRNNRAVEAFKYNNNSSRSSLRPRSQMTFATAALMDRSLLTYCRLFTVSVFLYGPNSAAACVTFTQVRRERCRTGPLGNKVILGSQRLSLLCWV